MPGVTGAPVITYQPAMMRRATPSTASGIAASCRFEYFS
jgi:hypothetical protein